MIKKIILTIFIIVLLAGGFFAWKLYRPAVNNPENAFFYISSTDNLQSVKDNLLEQQLIKGGNFDLVARLLKFRKVKPGRYTLKNKMSIYDLVKKLRSGEQDAVKMVIVKERTKELLSGKFGKGKKFDTEFDSLQMITFLSNNDSLKEFGVDTNTVMSIVMPYTYEIQWAGGPEKVVQQWHRAYKTFWNDKRKAKADSLHLTPVQVSILASIVEEETTRKADKYNVASTYLNRLAKGMKLQADPTVKFVTRNFRLGRITGSHLKLESPYNTYLYAGLPPGPICTPSIESLEAALDAPATEYLFFVASHKFDGSTVFTTNYNDHLKYVRLFHAEQNRRADSVRKSKATP